MNYTTDLMDLVFIHLNSKIPDYLRLNIARTSRLFPRKVCSLLLDQTVVSEGEQKIPANIILVSPDEQWTAVANRLSHPKDFRSNFWFSSLYRLIILAKYAITTDKPILHIESDVILSPNFPFSQMERIREKLAFPVFNESMGIASTILVNGASGGKLLLDNCMNEVDKSRLTTDMHILGNILDKYPNDVFPLPSSHPELERDIHGQSNKFAASHRHIESFKGIFDGLEFGQFIFGEDPRNHRGILKLRYPNLYGFLDVRKLRISANFNDELPNFLASNGKKYHIYSLHVHSKNRKLFKQPFAKYSKKFIVDFEKPSESKLVLRIFLLSVVRSIVRRIKLWKS
jgi:hypothetical protein